MPVDAEKENIILKKILKVLMSNQGVTFSEVQRKVGNLAKEVSENSVDVAEVLGNLYKEVVNEAFDPLKFQQKKGH